ncbi:MAG: hypothetical protein IJN42_03405 [Clostridia bacterium]|nr:hypothetical protein [Clostridia bacterium]
MITIFNRKEVCLTHDMQRQGDVRRALADAGIPYKVVTNPITSLRSRHGGTIGPQAAFLYQYKIFVHRRDYDRAKHVMAGSPR